MFSPIADPDTPSDYPSDSAIRAADWHILAGFWHPIALAQEVAETPVAARLLDVPLVLYRTEQGITVARDLCPHRGVRVSGGWLRDNLLICPMHGLHFDAAGQCRKIPSLPEQDSPISSKMRLQVFQSLERYGLVWVCLKETALWPLPDWPEVANPAYKKIHVPPDTWRASAPRHVENFNDLAHFPWVHRQSFGNETQVAVHDYTVEETSYGLRFEYPYVEGGNRFPDGVTAAQRRVLYRYELTFPFATLLRVAPQESSFVHYFADIASPLCASETRIFQLFTDTSGDPDAAFWLDDTRLINAEDKPLVESQPSALPLNPRTELHHLPADRWSLRYRQALVEKFGLGRA